MCSVAKIEKTRKLQKKGDSQIETCIVLFYVSVSKPTRIVTVLSSVAFGKDISLRTRTDVPTILDSNSTHFKVVKSMSEISKCC